ncbi:MAG: ATP-binding protein [Bacteroidales bacterium]|nr:ATP-binding protein [Bacteroidales bacterium]
MIRKIAITGPEPTGKSALAEALASHYKTVWVPEVAREYIAKLNRPYRKDDIEIIAKEQLRLENKMSKKAGKLLFCDTELIVTKIWSEFVFGSCAEWIKNTIKTHPYDLYLLMNIDLPWQEDPQREHPHRRKELFDKYYDELESHHFPFSVVSGTGEARIQSAIEVIKSHRLISF